MIASGRMGRVLLREVPQMSFLILAVLVAGVTAATVWLAETRAERENDPDSPFWYAFTGLCVLAPMILVPALDSRFSSAVLVVAAALSAIATHLFLRRQRSLALANVHRSHLEAGLAHAAEQHQELMDHWACYLLDPDVAVKFPAMTNIQLPETAALIHTMAATVQPADIHALTDDAVASYQRSVADLALALATAETAAAVT